MQFQFTKLIIIYKLLLFTKPIIIEVVSVYKGTFVQPISFF